MKTKQQAKANNKQAVSLIVLVITIIVMIILAGAIILSLNNNGIINQAQDAVGATNLKEVQTLASLKWSEAYIDGYTTQEELELEVPKRLSEEENIDLTPYQITITDEGVKVTLKSGNVENEQQPETPDEPETPAIPEEEENPWVVATVDGVPIPKGFVASPYGADATNGIPAENTKAAGLVIYELTPEEMGKGATSLPENETQHTSWTTRNQYVWVPVEDFSKFVRGAYDNTTHSNKLGTDYWEVVLDTTNMPNATQSTSYVTSTTLAEVQAMYESVKEYKGFYIARYEAGIDTQRTSKGNAADLPGIKEGTKVYSVMGKIPYTYIPWTKNESMKEDTNGAVQVARSIYPANNANYGVVSTLTYGVQWDATLQWWLDTEAVSSVKKSTSYGNYSDHVIAAGDLNDGAKYAVYSNTTLGSYQEATTSSTKASGTMWALSTGALKTANVNNIYDLAGNVVEWTMVGYSSSARVYCGGIFRTSGESTPVSYRYGTTINAVNYDRGFRPALYIKK